MKKYDIFVLESMDPFTTGLISTYYYGSKEKKQRRISSMLSVNVGNLDVLMSLGPSVALHPTLRNMLMGIVIYPKYLDWLSRNHSRPIRNILEARFLRAQLKILKKMSLAELSHLALHSVRNIRLSTCGGQLNIPFSPSVKDFLRNLNNSVVTLIQYMTLHEIGRKKLSLLTKQEILQPI